MLTNFIPPLLASIITAAAAIYGVIISSETQLSSMLKTAELTLKSTEKTVEGAIKAANIGRQSNIESAEINARQNTSLIEKTHLLQKQRELDLIEINRKHETEDAAKFIEGDMLARAEALFFKPLSGNLNKINAGTQISPMSLAFYLSAAIKEMRSILATKPPDHLYRSIDKLPPECIIAVSEYYIYLGALSERYASIKEEDFMEKMINVGNAMLSQEAQQPGLTPKDIQDIKTNKRHYDRIRDILIELMAVETLRSSGYAKYLCFKAVASIRKVALNDRGSSLKYLSIANANKDNIAQFEEKQALLANEYMKLINYLVTTSKGRDEKNLDLYLKQFIR